MVYAIHIPLLYIYMEYTVMVYTDYDIPSRGSRWTRNEGQIKTNLKTESGSLRLFKVQGLSHLAPRNNCQNHDHKKHGGDSDDKKLSSESGYFPVL